MRVVNVISCWMLCQNLPSWSFWYEIPGFKKARCSWDICLWNVMMSGMPSKVRAWILSDKSLIFQVRKSGSPKWHKFSFLNLKDKHGKNCHQLSTWTNITNFVCFLPNQLKIPADFLEEMYLRNLRQPFVENSLQPVHGRLRWEESALCQLQKWTLNHQWWWCIHQQSATKSRYSGKFWLLNTTWQNKTGFNNQPGFNN